MAIEEEELLDYACVKFQNGMYEEALEAFVLAYSKGYEPEWVLDNVYNCYMAGNEEEFYNAYERQTENLGIAYEDCILDFIPYRDGEYYIFDKEIGNFRGLFSVRELQEMKPDPSLQSVEFSAAVLEMEWNWKEEAIILSEAIRRKVYVISHDMRRFLSFFKIPELADYVKNIKTFADHQELQDYFHQNTAVYLPKIICGKEEDKQELIKIMDEEHLYRLTSQGRNTENVLLTIGIPTHERGNLVLKRLENLLPMPYDAEIEIVISKNGTKRYQEEYREVSKIPDARINYFDHGKEIHPTENWAYVLEMAHGKYVLMVSDEDDVVINALEHYLKLLSDFPDLSLMRAKTRFQYHSMEERLYGKKGREAFQYEFAGQNYLSGLIIRREDFIAENMLRLQKYADNPYYQYYPHEWWCAILSQRGDYMQEPFVLIDEQECVAGEEAKQAMPETDEDIWGASYVPDFGTYEARLKQFRGQLDFLHLFCGEDKDMAEIGVDRAIGKTAVLFDLARKRNYDCENYLNMMDQYVACCIEAVEEFNLDSDQKRRLLLWIRSCYEYMYNEHIKSNTEQGL